VWKYFGASATAMILPITKFGNPVLRKKGVPLERFDKSTVSLISDMLETMFAARGIGLAAQQIGEPLQLAIVYAADKKSNVTVDGINIAPDKVMPIILINPLITTSGEEYGYEEGCLSLKGIFSNVSRPKHIKMVTYWNPITRQPKRTVVEAEGLTGRAILHEADHLNGILFTDHLSTEQRNKIAKVVIERKLKSEEYEQTI